MDRTIPGRARQRSVALLVVSAVAFSLWPARVSAAAVGRGAGACASPALAAPRLGPAEIPPAVRALAGNRTDESAWFGLTVDQPLGAGAFLIAPSGTRYAGAYVRAGGAWKRFSFEQRLPFRGRPFYHGPPALELRADWFDGRTLYLEFPPEAAATSVQCVTLESAAQAASDGPPDGIIFYFGLLTAIALYNLLLFAGTREASAGWYVGYLAMLGIYQFMRANFGWALFAPTGWFEESNVEFFAFTTTLAVHGQFSRVLLETRKHLPRLDRAIVLVIGALVLVHPTLQLLAVHMPIFREAMPLPTIVLLPAFAGLIIWAAIARRREGYPPARFFLLSYSVLCGFTLLAVFAWAYGITGRLIDYSAEFGTGAECILLSLAVADRLRMERRLQSLVGQLPDVVVRARRNGTISYVSANVAHRFGYEPNRLIGRRIAEFVGNDDPRTLARAARNALRLTSAANPVELQLKRANGSLATVEVVGRPTIAGTRPPSRSAEWQYTVRDVSALRTAREQLVRVSAAAPVNHPLRISLFGAKLERDGEPIRLTPREIELLAFLAVRADPSLTAVLTATIWPDLGDRAGANALHVTVSRVRHKVVDVPIVTFGDAGYALDSRVAVDVRELQRAVAELGRMSLASADLARYEPLRAEVARRIPDQLAHHEWFAPHAVLLERLRRDLFVRLARCALAQRALDRALELANELIRLDPTDETAYSVAIEVHLAQGDEAAAYRAYRDCRRVLLAELGVEPSEAIRDRLGATNRMGRLGA